MRDILVTAIVLGLLPVALFEPFVGVALWTWLSVMNPHRLTWGFAYNFPFAQVTAIVTLLSLAVAHKKVKFPVTPLTITLIAFFLWINFTLLFAIHFQESIENWSRVTKTLLMTLVALACVRTDKQIRIFLWIFVMSVAFFGIKGGVFAILTGGNFLVYGPPNSQIDDNNAISVALVMMIPLMAFLHQHIERRWLRYGMLVAILLTAAAVLASYSRGAFVACCAMLFFLALKSRRRVLFLFLLALSIPIMLTAMPQKWWDRMGTITAGEADPSVRGRFNAWGMAWNLALDRPIVGGGFAIYEPDVFAKYAPNPLDLHSAHSIYFQMLGEHGFVGLALFLLIALLMWRAGTRIVRNSTAAGDRWRADLARALQVSMVGFLVGGMSVNIGYWDVYYFELVLLVALEQLAQRTESRQVATSAAPAAVLP